MIEESAPRLAAKTIKTNKERAQQVKLAIGHVSMRRVDADTIRSYQNQRLKAGIAPRTINMEVGAIRRALMRAKLWRKIEDDVKGLEERRDLIPEVLTPKQKSKLFRIAASNPDWSRAYCAAAIAVTTTARKIEVLTSRFKEVDLIDGTWRVGRSKTQAGIRIIKLNPEARAAFARMFELANTADELKPDNFIFPACENRILDYSKPQKSLRTAWRALTKKAGLKFRMHDLRHQAITELNEAGVPESVIMSMCGHLSRKMMDHYTHIRTDAKTKAAAVLGGTGILGAEPVPEVGEEPVH